MDTQSEKNNVQNETEVAASGAKTHRKRNLVIVTLLFLITAAVVALAYFLFWQHEEETEDAYVAGHLVMITPQVNGTVRKVMYDDTDVVKKGDVLVALDDSDFQLAYDRAQNELIQAIRQNKQQTAVNSKAKAQVLLRKADLARAQADLRRRESLAGTEAVSGEELSHARAAVVQAQAALKAVEAEEVSAQAALGSNIPLRQQPAVQTAISHIKDAWLNLQRTQIRSPISGQIAKRNVQVGQRIVQGTPMMAVVPLSELWVDANFKESQLRKMKIGQPVEMTADLYGSKVVYHGKVMGLS
ncbi:efflux RND transporter periplasmic adaptor subunit, partial [Neisseria sp. P0006.S006]